MRSDPLPDLEPRRSEAPPWDPHSFPGGSPGLPPWRNAEPRSIFYSPSSSQNQGGTFSGAIPWTLGALNSGAGFAVAINQIIGLNPLAASTDASGTVQLVAGGPQTVSISLNAGTLDYFGAPDPGGISVTIIPEPTTAGLLGLGLLSLAVAGRRR